MASPRENVIFRVGIGYMLEGGGDPLLENWIGLE